MTNDIPEGMIAFDLAKALAGWPCVTRSGREVRISFVSNLLGDKKCPLLGWLNQDSNWGSCGWDIHGFSNESKTPLPLDLFLKKKTITYWQNIYRNADRGIYVGSKIYKTEQEAKNFGESFDSYLKTISFELDDVEIESAKPKKDCHLVGKGHGFGLTNDRCLDCGYEKPKNKKLWIAIGKERSLNCHYTSNAYPSLKDLKILDINKYWLKEIEVENDGC